MHQCVQNGENKKVFALFKEMHQKNVQPTRFIRQTMIDANVELGNSKCAGKLFKRHFGSPAPSQQSGKPHLDCHEFSPQTAYVQLTEFLKKHEKTPFSVIVG